MAKYSFDVPEEYRRLFRAKVQKMKASNIRLDSVELVTLNPEEVWRFTLQCPAQVYNHLLGYIEGMRDATVDAPREHTE